MALAREHQTDSPCELPSTGNATKTPAKHSPLEFERAHAESERTIASASNVLTERFFVWREDAHRFATARDAHIPLLRVRRGADRRISQEYVIDCLALGTV